jgi:RNA polymerase sigma factor FliA
MMASPCGDVGALAVNYASTRARADRDRLCEAAMPLVRRIALVVRRRLPQHFGYDDLVGDGCIGLLRAVERFDPSFGVSFESWAGRIIRGAMLNGLRRMDAIPERVRRDARALDEARWLIAQRTGTSPADHEAAQSAQLSINKLAAVRVASRHSMTLSIDAPVPANGRGVPIVERLVSALRDPAAVVAASSVRRIIGRSVARLPGRERAIIAAFYGRGATFSEIGRTLGVSKQRVSQLHTRAIAGLRTALADLSRET